MGCGIVDVVRVESRMWKVEEDVWFNLVVNDYTQS